MTNMALKKQIHAALEIIENPEILKAVHLILDQEIKHKKQVISPFSFEEFYARNSKSQKEIKQGKLVDHKIVKGKYLDLCENQRF